MKKKAGFLAVIYVTIGVLISCKSTGLVKSKAYYEGICNDINRIEFNLKLHSCMSDIDPSAFELLKKQVMDEKLSESETLVRLQEIIAKYNVAHLYINAMDENIINEKVLPFSFRYFNEGYYLNKSTEQFKQYLGCKMISFAGMTPSEAVVRISKLKSKETESTTKYYFSSLIHFEDLKYLGMLDENNHVDISLEDSAGNTVNLKADFVSPDVEQIRYVPEKMFQTYVNQIDERNYYLIPVPEEKIMYVQYKSCYDDRDLPFEVFFKDMINQLKEEDYETVVFDLRDNTGGNSGVANIPLNVYKDFLNNYNIGVVFNGLTFSSSCQFMDACLSNFNKVTFFGEETGQAVHNLTNVRTIDLVNLKAVFSYPTIEDYVPMLEARSKDTSKGTYPDVFLSELYSDFATGKDTIYQEIVKYYANR